MKKIFCFLSVIFSILNIVVAQEKSKPISREITKLEVLINTVDTTIKINGKILNSLEINEIEKIIGKPNRIKKHTFHSNYEKFGLKGTRTSIPIKVTNYYYIYDNLGIMFFTNNGKTENNRIEKFSIHYKNKRTFSNTELLPYTPIAFFNGVLKINGKPVESSKKIIDENVNYMTENIQLFNIKFGSTSITTIIDGLYTHTSEPYMFIFLNNEKEQRISYLVINGIKK
jgi:hypothetical protein